MSVRNWGSVAGAGFALAVALSIVGNILEKRGVDSPTVKTVIIAGAVGAFVAIAVAIPPLALRFFLSGQAAAGNGGLAVVAFMVRHEVGIVRGIWVFMALGIAIAAPHILRAVGGRG